MASLNSAAATAAISAARNAAANAVTALCNGGSVRIYSGTPPADATAALSGNALLAELPFSATAFAAAISGVATANAITADSVADATGAPTFFRAMSSAPAVVFQGTAGASGAELNLSGLSAGNIVAGTEVSISSFTYTQVASF